MCSIKKFIHTHINTVTWTMPEGTSLPARTSHSLKDRDLPSLLGSSRNVESEDTESLYNYSVHKIVATDLTIIQSELNISWMWTASSNVFWSAYAVVRAVIRKLIRYEMQEEDTAVLLRRNNEWGKEELASNLEVPTDGKAVIIPNNDKPYNT